MREFKETFEILAQDLADPSQSSNLREVYEKLDERLYQLNNRADADSLPDDYILGKNHAELQLICAKELIKQGYSVDVERTLPEYTRHTDDRREPEATGGIIKPYRTLACDIHSAYSNGARSSSLIAEAEIRYYFDPESFIVDLKNTKENRIDRSFTRIVSKIARYSVHADLFGIVVYEKSYFFKHYKQDSLSKLGRESLLSTHGSVIKNQLRIPSLMLEPPMLRDWDDIKLLKKKADEWYAKPKVTADEIRHGIVHYVYAVDPENLSIERYNLRKPEPSMVKPLKI